MKLIGASATVLSLALLATGCGGSSFADGSGGASSSAGTSSGGKGSAGQSGSSTSGGSESGGSASGGSASGGESTGGGSSGGTGSGGVSNGGVNSGGVNSGGVSSGGVSSGGVSSGGVSNGGAGGTDTACNEDTDCTVCAYPTAPQTADQCYCATCAFTPMTKTACTANQADFAKVCADVHRPCPAIACVLPPTPTCKSHKCVASQ